MMTYGHRRRRRSVIDRSEHGGALIKANDEPAANYTVACMSGLFHLRRDHVTASEYRAARARAFEVWADISGVAAAA
jgi:hypothetical protein